MLQDDTTAIDGAEPTVAPLEEPTVEAPAEAPASVPDAPAADAPAPLEGVSA